jgi:hypothetical protein
LGDALIAHVESQSLDALEELSEEIKDPKRAEETLTRALAEVFDGPLVRQLLARRAKIRREKLSDKAGAASDLRKLHDLSPSDQAIMDDLSALLVELGDYRSMVQVYEDQLLRGKDTNARSELARKVARMWEEQLEDPREAADAWRRVLRMKAGDVEATAGLERAKSTMLKKPDPDASDAYSPPKLGPPASMMPPPTMASSVPASTAVTAENSPAVVSPTPPEEAEENDEPLPEEPEENDEPLPEEPEEAEDPSEDEDTPIPRPEASAEAPVAETDDAQDSEAPVAADAETKSPFADVDLAFAQITTVAREDTTEEAAVIVAKEPSRVEAAPGSSPVLSLGEEEDAGLDFSDLSDPSPPDPVSPEADAAPEGDVLVIDDIAEDLEEFEAEEPLPGTDSEAAPAQGHGTSPSPIPASSIPPPLPRH